ncbi:uncharacterized protein DS421_10g311550 [Arachis hypogaea]|nr:uncharacterized protein DS421_10g311550 [Arachis hypogaea]
MVFFLNSIVGQRCMLFEISTNILRLKSGKNIARGIPARRAPPKTGSIEPIPHLILQINDFLIRLNKRRVLHRFHVEIIVGAHWFNDSESARVAAPALALDSAPRRR